MKMRRRAKLLKHRLQARVKYYATEEELFDAVRASLARMQDPKYAKLARKAEQALPAKLGFRRFGASRTPSAG